MFLNYIITKIKAIFINILSIFRRALCCFSRRRRNSNSDCEVLSSISIVNNNNNNTMGITGLQIRNKERDVDWNSWDDSPKTIDEHIERYRQKLAKPPTPKDEEPEMNFFEDMTPKIKKQTKLLIKTESNDESVNSFSRLQASSIPVVNTGVNLEDITDDEAQDDGWEECNDAHTKQLIIEKRKEMREQRKQQKLQKDAAVINSQRTPQIFAERIRSIR